MGINIAELWTQMGPVAKIVVVILGIMSAYSISIMIERFLVYRQARKQSRVFTPAVAECLKEGKIDEELAKQYIVGMEKIDDEGAPSAKKGIWGKK